MPDEVKTCRFYHFLKCGETNCCNCPHHPLHMADRDFMFPDEREKLANKCLELLENTKQPVTAENVIEALYQNNVIHPASARVMIGGESAVRVYRPGK